MARRLRTEGGWLFILGLSGLFTVGGIDFVWRGLTGEPGSWTPAVMLLAFAAILLGVGREDILAAWDVRREGVEIPATVTGILLSRTMSVNRAWFRWRIQASGQGPDGRPAEFLSPTILSAKQPGVRIGSPVTVRIAPSGRYRMDLHSLVLAETLEPGLLSAAESFVRRRWPLLLAVVIMVAWGGLVQLDRRVLDRVWVVIPLVVLLLLADLIRLYLPRVRDVMALVGLFRSYREAQVRDAETPTRPSSSKPPGS